MKPMLDLKGVRSVHLWEYVARFAFGGAVSVVTTLVARAYGPLVGGLFLAFPSIFPASITLVKRHDGRAKALDDARGARIGGGGMIAFALVVWAGSERYSPLLVLASGLATWALVSVGLWILRYGREPQPADR
jgi:uncharacterized protein DUF3147